MDPKLVYEYHQFMQQVGSCKNITEAYLSSLGLLAFQSYQQNRFSEPMPWIGVYIALASLFCILAMVADLLHGLKNRQLWFPCKCFTMNAASLTVIAVAMKLPVDLNNQMPGYVDQAAKLGSMGFMCTIMANLLPSLATMDKKELVSNIIAVGILVITFVVNVCIQITTGLLSFHGDEAAEAFGQVLSGIFPAGVYLTAHRFIPAIYVSVLLMLLIIYACSSLAILKSKQILESKYQSAHETILKDQELLQQPGRLLTVEKVTQHVSNYWVMAGTGSPQFMTVCSATTSASGVICAFTTVLHILIMISVTGSLKDFQSDYKWSMLVILVIHFMGTILGTIAPLCRCFAVLSFKLSVKWIWNHIKVSTVETYWTEKLSDWKQSSIPFPWGSRKCKIVIENVKILILNVCIGFQKTVLVTCKMIAVIPLLFVICVLSCFRCWKWLKAMFFSAPSIVLVKNPEQLDKDKDLSRCVLQLQDDMEFPERTLKGILKSVNRLIQKAEKQQPNNLMNLLKESRGFEGVEKFDSHLVPPLLSKEYLTSWSLTLVSLTTIAISLPNIQNNIVDCLLSSVSEGLVYVTLVEETLNTINDHVTIQKAAKTLWLEVEVYHKWLGNKLTKPEPQANTVGQILRWLRDTAKNIVTDLETIDIGSRNNNDKSICRFISANSMYRIIETTMLSYNDDVDLVTQEELFAQLLSMIADILAACLINLPQVIAVKCHASTIEKRETSVHVAAQLLGETMQIINTLKDRQLPSLNLDELAYIEKWCAYFTPPFP